MFSVKSISRPGATSPSWHWGPTRKALRRRPISGRSLGRIAIWVGVSVCGWGKVKEARLQAYVVSKGLPFKVSVVTGPSGSYREHDILNFLEIWLMPWGPGREWEVFLLDAYAPGLTDNVQRLCWSREVHDERVGE